MSTYARNLAKLRGSAARREDKGLPAFQTGSKREKIDFALREGGFTYKTLADRIESSPSTTSKEVLYVANAMDREIATDPVTKTIRYVDRN
jgi:hypothetical protein